MEKSINIYGLVIRTKKVLIALLFLILGISLILSGFIEIYIENVGRDSEISDAEVIERAKKLGMVHLKDYLRIPKDQ